MMTLYFEVELKTDIILNQKAVTQGANTTLDYIPGSNFLGIVAGAVYKDDMDQKLALDLFHNGTVCFGDAHLKAPSGARTLKVPAAYFYPKGEEPCDKLFVSHLIPKDEKTQQEMRKIQLKQCRSGYYDFTVSDQKAVPVECGTNFAIKSAHNRETRTSLDEAMYGYESLQAGAKMLFEVQIIQNETILEPIIVNALTQGGSKRVGRSRSAQFGLVEIKHLDKPYIQAQGAAGTGKVAIYADSRLIFLDSISGLPTFQPTAEQLGFKQGKINWKESQIRTFQYSPWNFKRQCFDTDRCGLEKGSVIIVEDVSEPTPTTAIVGSYKNEGFGHIIYNPDFLDGDKSTGVAQWKLSKATKETEKPKESDKALSLAAGDSDLIYRLKSAHNQVLFENKIFMLVNHWKEANKSKFKSDSFASQWGTIRSIATRRLFAQSGDTASQTLYEELFAEGTGYLRHGVAKSKWEEGRKFEAFRNFFKYDLIEFPDDETQCLAVINLAAEMSKLYRRKED